MNKDDKTTRVQLQRTIHSLRLWLCLGVAALVLAPYHASAQFIGNQLSWQYYAYGGAYTEEFVFTATGCVVGTFAAGEIVYFNIIVEDSSITFDYSPCTNCPDTWSDSELSFPPGVYNGIVIRLVTPSLPDIASVSINPATNMAGFDASRVSWSGRWIGVDWKLLSFDSSTIVKLDVATVAEDVWHRPQISTASPLDGCDCDAGENPIAARSSSRVGSQRPEFNPPRQVIESR